MSLDAEYDFIKKLRKMWHVLIGIVLIVGFIGVIGAGAIWFAPENNRDFYMFIAQIVSVLVTILMVGVIGLQAEIMRRQNKILEVDRPPMLVFKKIKAGEWAFEIINSSKYPVKIEFDDFIPEKYYNKKFEEEQKGRRLRKVSQKVRFHHKLREVFIYPEQKIKIPDEFEADIDVPGVLKIKASNVYFSDLSLKYEYDISSGRINRIEGLP